MGTQIECDTCGETFEVGKYREDTARFCSVGCRAEWQSSAYEGDGAPNYQGKKERYVCDYCGDTFTDYPSQNDGRFCSGDCYHDWQRYYEPIDLTVSNEGYPIFNSSHGMVAHHRLLATLLVDDISELEGKHIHHSEHPIWPERTDEVNIAVTYLDNLEVVSASEHSKHHHKTTPRKGSDVGSSVLDEDDVREIREKHESGDYTYAELSDEYDTSQSNIGMIVNRETWQHVE